MADTPPATRESGPAGCLAGLLIGLLTVAAAEAGLYLSGRAPPDVAEEWPFILLHMALAAAPFVLLAGLGVAAKLPWLVGLGLTASFWGYAFLDAVWIHRGEGANIGLGMTMLAAPFAIAAASVWAAKASGTLPDR